MEEIIARRPTRAPTHPGVVLRETVIPRLGISVKNLAAALHVTRQQVHRILSEQSAISPEMALRLGKFCGNGPTLWIRMQEAHDLWHARQKIGADVDAIQTVEPTFADV